MTPETPTHNPTHIYCIVTKFISHGRQEFTLRRPCLVAVFLRVQIEGRLNLAVTQNPCTVLGSTFALFTSQLLKL